MPYRRTNGILTDSPDADVPAEADVIMTAAVVGFTAGQLMDRGAVRFDMNPDDAAQSPADWQHFERVVDGLSSVVDGYLSTIGRAGSGRARAGVAPRFHEQKGGVIVGVYGLAGQEPPASFDDPKLSEKGAKLYAKIRAEEVPQYVGYGAYTGFVDNPNTAKNENTDPVGPRSTARFLMPGTGADGADGAVPRWLPSPGSPAWKPRERYGKPGDFVPWGLLGGSEANEPTKDGSSNKADAQTATMAKEGMAYVGEPTTGDVVGYTHGMVQAIYKAYSLGPSCTPYEIAVGTKTTKLASCFACTTFMTAVGYPPSSTHLGKGESWAPLYAPYNPGGKTEPNEAAVLRDLNAAWARKTSEWLRLGVAVLEEADFATRRPSHGRAFDDLHAFLGARPDDRTVGATLMLDALTINENETKRLGRTLA